LATFCRRPVSALKSVVFPQLGLPASATVRGAEAIGVSAATLQQEADIAGASLLRYPAAIQRCWTGATEAREIKDYSLGRI
jgi:hypothetical protein